MYDYIILGAGPAGLTFANLIKETGKSFLVLEKEEEAGGLCRSKKVDGSDLDIAGGHFLDVRRPKVNEFLFSFMPEDEWNIFDRDSRIDLGEFFVNHPLEANIWQIFLIAFPAIVIVFLSFRIKKKQTKIPQENEFHES